MFVIVFEHCAAFFKVFANNFYPWSLVSASFSMVLVYAKCGNNVVLSFLCMLFIFVNSALIGIRIRTKFKFYFLCKPINLLETQEHLYVFGWSLVSVYLTIFSKDCATLQYYSIK